MDKFFNMECMYIADKKCNEFCIAYENAGCKRFCNELIQLDILRDIANNLHNIVEMHVI